MNCPKWEKCFAPICPLDPDWQIRSHQNGDRTCFWLTESVKKNAHANFESAAKSEILSQIQTLTPAIVARWYSIRRGLEKASGTGSKLTAFKKG
jgi:hypothetical protein